MVTLICANSTCQKTFTTKPSEVRDGAKYCSHACHHPAFYLICANRNCEKQFRAKPSEIKVGKKFCSQYCAYNYEPTEQEYFWSYVEKTETCWLWLGTIRDDGYGEAHPGGGKRVLAHRHSYEIAYGLFFSRLHVLHHCDNPPCINPAHLFLETQSDNVQDAAKKGRMRFGELHPRSRLTNSDIRFILSLQGSSTPKEVAKLFNCSDANIYKIWKRQAWKHIE